VLFGIAQIKADLAHLILQVVECYTDGTRCAVGIEQNKACRAAGTGVSTVVTGERRTGISRVRAGIKRFIAVLGTGTVEAIIRAGIARVHRAAPATAGIGTVAEKQVITGGCVIGMGTYSRTVTLIIRTHIAVIGTGGAWRIKTGVRCLLAGIVTVRSSRTGISRVHRAAPATTGIGAVAEQQVIAGSGVIGMGTGPGTVTLIIGAHIAVIGTGCA
jgi:hypothetical protein